MSVSDHASPGGRRRPAHRARQAARAGDAEVLDRLPDSDFLSALWNLPDDLRLAVYLADIAGCPYREIAEIMGTPISTVKVRLHRARRRLRDMLTACAVRRGLAAPRW
ncbi:MAG TPA: sigma factor-like helix-turn-helix DNA-binding protein [Streptosporangiaceae bacterium]|nr:sigma factor-like helix-turn-helix DNA-binding protein [Streptosporangiaceae bacterium]